MSDTGAGTPLTEAGRRLVDDYEKVDWLPASLRSSVITIEIEAADLFARSRPATDPAGLDVERLARAMDHVSKAGGAQVKWGSHRGSIADQIAAEYARLSVADGPGPEGRLREALAIGLGDALTIDWPGDTRLTTAPAIAEYLMRRPEVRAVLALPEHREEPTDG